MTDDSHSHSSRIHTRSNTGSSSGLGKSQADDDIAVDAIFSAHSNGLVVILRKTEKPILHSICRHDTADWVVFTGCDGCHHTRLWCVWVRVWCVKKPTLGIPIVNPNNPRHQGGVGDQGKVLEMGWR